MLKYIFGIIIFTFIHNNSAKRIKVSLSDDKYSYDAIPANCNNAVLPEYDIEGHPRLTLVWTPVHRRRFEKWMWIDNNTYERLHRNIEYIDCALLQLDAYIIDAELCAKKYEVLCYIPMADRKVCPDTEGRCFRISSFLYMQLKHELSWYQAKEECDRKGMELAYFDPEHLRDLVKEIKRMNPSSHSVWIGLRKAEFQFPGGNPHLVWDYNQPEGCEACDCAVAVLNKSQIDRLQARPCHEQHKVLCPVGTEITKIVTSSERPTCPTLTCETHTECHGYTGHFLIVTSILSSLVVGLIVSVSHILYFKKWHKKKRRDFQKINVHKDLPTCQTEQVLPFIENPEPVNKDLEEDIVKPRSNQSIVFNAGYDDITVQ